MKHSNEFIGEGAPCGVDGCRETFTSDEYWRQHCKQDHPEYYDKELKPLKEKLWFSSSKQSSEVTKQ